jgi:hypothetical protein
MKCYKLTDENLQTHNNTQWVLGEWKKPSYLDATVDLCSGAWLHGYLDPVLAVLLNPRHADFANPRLFEAEAKGEVKYDGQLKFGCQKMRLVKELALPKILLVKRVGLAIKLAIKLALKVNKDKNFTKWAKNWLNNKDRSAKSAEKASDAAYDAAWAASYAAYNAAYNAASKAARAAYAASDAAYNAASKAARAAYAASDAAYNAAYNAANAAYLLAQKRQRTNENARKEVAKTVISFNQTKPKANLAKTIKLIF